MTQQSTVTPTTQTEKMLRTAALAEFQAVRRSRQYEQVAKQIQRLVIRGVLKPGDRLPAERELATKFGVSRSSIRDAIRTLEVIGILEPRQGKGTVVREVSTDSLVVPLTRVLLRKRELVAELLDVRRMIEPALAARAAANASPEEIARMEGILQRQQEKMRRGEDTIEEDSEFHYVVALAAGNNVVLKVLDVLMDLLRESRARSLQVLGRRERSYAGHRQILRAIKRRDRTAAAAAARRHLKEIEEITMRKL
jgi:GntR family transcriptional repressor for pyruvate dehydrogenase complex